jgi:hypothetical protein
VIPLKDEFGNVLDKEEWTVLNEVVHKGTQTFESEQIFEAVIDNEGLVPSALSFLFPIPLRPGNKNVNLDSLRDRLQVANMVIPMTSGNHSVHLKTCLNLLKEPVQLYPAACKDEAKYNDLLDRGSVENYLEPMVHSESNVSWGVLMLLFHHTIRHATYASKDSFGSVVGWVMAQPDVNSRVAEVASIIGLKEVVQDPNTWDTVGSAAVYIAPYEMREVASGIHTQVPDMTCMVSGAIGEDAVGCPIADSDVYGHETAKSKREKKYCGKPTPLTPSGSSIFYLLASLCGIKSSKHRMNFMAYLRNDIFEAEHLKVPVEKGKDEFGFPIVNNEALESWSSATSEDQTRAFMLCLLILERVFNGLREYDDWSRLYVVLISNIKKSEVRDALLRLAPTTQSELIRQTVAVFQAHTNVRISFVEGQKRMCAINTAVYNLDLEAKTLDISKNNLTLEPRTDLVNMAIFKSLSLHVKTKVLIANNPKHNIPDFNKKVCNWLRKYSATITNTMIKVEKREWKQVTATLIESYQANALSRLRWGSKAEMFIKWLGERRSTLYRILSEREGNNKVVETDYTDFVNNYKGAPPNAKNFLPTKNHIEFANFCLSENAYKSTIWPSQAAYRKKPYRMPTIIDMIISIGSCPHGLQDFKAYINSSGRPNTRMYKNVGGTLDFQEPYDVIAEVSQMYSV